MYKFLFTVMSVACVTLLINPAYASLHYTLTAVTVSGNGPAGNNDIAGGNTVSASDFFAATPQSGAMAIQQTGQSAHDHQAVLAQRIQPAQADQKIGAVSAYFEQASRESGHE